LLPEQLGERLGRLAAGSPGRWLRGGSPRASGRAQPGDHSVGIIGMVVQDRTPPPVPPCTAAILVAYVRAGWCWVVTLQHHTLVADRRRVIPSAYSTGNVPQLCCGSQASTTPCCSRQQRWAVPVCRAA
jgi:hypothetical protein